MHLSIKNSLTLKTTAMNTNNKSFEDFDELVFENKNKTYGAYAIRRSYNDHVTISLLATLAFFGSIAFLGVWLTNNKIELPSLPDGNEPLVYTQTIEYNVPEPQKVEKKIDQKVDATPKTTSGQMAATDDKDKTVDKTNDQVVISKNPNPTGTDSSITNHQTLIIKKPETNEAKAIADIMPEFNGNLFHFLVDKLKYPRLALEAGTSGTVYLQFIVEKDGSIGEITTLKGVSDGCTEEAIRVVKAMPNWKPGKNHGEPVRVIFNLPVKFTLQ